MMAKSFSTREKALLLLLAVLLVAAFYYLAIHNPTVETISRAEIKISEIQDDLVAEEKKAEQTRIMQTALEEMTGESVTTTIIPVYDNLEKLLVELNNVLSFADQYKLNFSNIVIENDVANRTLQLIFYASDYGSAKSIISELYSGPYRCKITSLKLAPEKQESSDLLNAPVIVTMEIVYYELYK